jgi:hypothetical protein
MKAFAVFAAIFPMAAPVWGATLTLEDVSPHFATNAPIVWSPPTNELPKRLWTYRRQPRVFPATTISNAVVLASFQNKGFPQPSTNRSIIWADHPDEEPRPPYLDILPDVGQISYSLGDRVRLEDASKDAWAVERGWDCLLQLGMDRTQFVKKNVARDGTGGVFLPRQIDGIEFGAESGGFQIAFDRNGKLVGFYLAFPDLKREGSDAPARPDQIIRCIRTHKTPLSPFEYEEGYFEAVKNLAAAKKLTIARVTLFYMQGVYGESPTNDELPQVFAPIAELKAVADYGRSNATVRLLSPVLASDVARVLGKK